MERSKIDTQASYSGGLSHKPFDIKVHAVNNFAIPSVLILFQHIKMYLCVKT